MILGYCTGSGFETYVGGSGYANNTSDGTVNGLPCYIYSITPTELKGRIADVKIANGTPAGDTTISSSGSAPWQFIKEGAVWLPWASSSGRS